MAKFIVVEFGKDDNRPLGRSGQFLSGEQVTEREVAEFTSRDAALVAVEKASRRPGTTVDVVGRVA